MLFQGFYKLTTSVDRFKRDTSVVVSGKRHYVAVYSVDGSSVAPPGMKEDTYATSVVDSSGSSSVTITCYVILLLLLLQFLHV